MILPIIIFTVAFVAQYTLLFGWSYIMYRFLMKESADIRGIRKMARCFGGFATLLAFLILVVRQVVVQDSWVHPFVAPVWVATLFVAHDLALGSAIKKREVGGNP